MSITVWHIAHWLDHVVHWLYEFSDRLENKSCTYQDISS